MASGATLVTGGVFSGDRVKINQRKMIDCVPMFPRLCGVLGRGVQGCYLLLRSAKIPIRVGDSSRRAPSSIYFGKFAPPHLDHRWCLFEAFMWDKVSPQNSSIAIIHWLNDLSA